MCFVPLKTITKSGQEPTTLAKFRGFQPWPKFPDSIGSRSSIATGSLERLTTEAKVPYIVVIVDYKINYDVISYSTL